MSSKLRRPTRSELLNMLTSIHTSLAPNNIPDGSPQHSGFRNDVLDEQATQEALVDAYYIADSLGLHPLPLNNITEPNTMPAESPAQSHKRPTIDAQTMIDELVAQYLPQIEQTLRLRLQQQLQIAPNSDKNNNKSTIPLP